MRYLFRILLVVHRKLRKVNEVIILCLVLSGILGMLCLIASTPKDAPFRSNMFCMYHTVSDDGVPFYELTSLIWDLPIKAKPGYSVKMLPYGERGQQYAEVRTEHGRLVARAYIR